MKKLFGALLLGLLLVGQAGLFAAADSDQPDEQAQGLSDAQIAEVMYQKIRSELLTKIDKYEAHLKRKEKKLNDDGEKLEKSRDLYGSDEQLEKTDEVRRALLAIFPSAFEKIEAAKQIIGSLESDQDNAFASELNRLYEETKKGDLQKAMTKDNLWGAFQSDFDSIKLAWIKRLQFLWISPDIASTEYANEWKKYDNSNMAKELRVWARENIGKFIAKTRKFYTEKKELLNRVLSLVKDIEQKYGSDAMIAEITLLCENLSSLMGPAFEKLDNAELLAQSLDDQDNIITRKIAELEESVRTGELRKRVIFPGSGFGEGAIKGQGEMAWERGLKDLWRTSSVDGYYSDPNHTEWESLKNAEINLAAINDFYTEYDKRRGVITKFNAFKDSLGVHISALIARVEAIGGGSFKRDDRVVSLRELDEKINKIGAYINELELAREDKRGPKKVRELIFFRRPGRDAWCFEKRRPDCFLKSSVTQYGIGLNYGFEEIENLAETDITETESTLAALTTELDEIKRKNDWKNRVYASAQFNEIGLIWDKLKKPGSNSDIRDKLQRLTVRGNHIDQSAMVEWQTAIAGMYQRYNQFEKEVFRLVSEDPESQDLSSITAHGMQLNSDLTVLLADCKERVNIRFNALPVVDPAGADSDSSEGQLPVRQRIHVTAGVANPAISERVQPLQDELDAFMAELQAARNNGFTEEIDTDEIARELDRSRRWDTPTSQVWENHFHDELARAHKEIWKFNKKRQMEGPLRELDETIGHGIGHGEWIYFVDDDGDRCYASYSNLRTRLLDTIISEVENTGRFNTAEANRLFDQRAQGHYARLEQAVNGFLREQSEEREEEARNKYYGVLGASAPWIIGAGIAALIKNKKVNERAVKLGVAKKKLAKKLAQAQLMPEKGEKFEDFVKKLLESSRTPTLIKKSLEQYATRTKDLKRAKTSRAVWGSISLAGLVADIVYSIWFWKIRKRA